MTAELRTRAWRGWLYASLPLVCVFVPAAVFSALEAQPPSSLPFTLSDASSFIPFPTRVALLSPFATAIALAVVFFRWGKRDRPTLKRALVLTALPWLIGSVHMEAYWRYGVLWFISQVGSVGAGTLAASMAELFATGAATAFASILLFISLLGVLALDARGVGLIGARSAGESPSMRLPRLLRTSIIGLTLASALCAALAANAGRGFFIEITVEGLAEWTRSPHGDASGWAWLHSAQFFLAAAAVVSILAGLLAQRRVPAAARGDRSPLLLAATLLGFVHGTNALFQGSVLSEFAHALEATDGPRTSHLLPSEGEATSFSLRPALSISSQGIQLPGQRGATWASGRERIEHELAAYRQQRAIKVSGTSELPFSVVVAVEQDTNLAALLCLAEAASGLGMTGLDLATGPEHDVPVRTRRALSCVSSALGQAFTQTVAITPFSLATHGCDESEAEHKWAIELGPTAGAEDATRELPDACRSHRHCIEVRLTKDATMRDLLRLLQGAGQHAAIALAPGTASSCR